MPPLDAGLGQSYRRDPQERERGGRRASSLLERGRAPAPAAELAKLVGIDRSINLIRFLKEMGWAVRIQTCETAEFLARTFLRT